MAHPVDAGSRRRGRVWARDRGLVSHRPRRDVHRRLLAQHAGRLGLERDDGGVLAPDVVAHLGLGHRPAHLRRRPRDGVGAEVDGSHRAAEYPARRASPRRRLSTPGQGARIRRGARGRRGRADRRRRAVRRRRPGRDGGRDPARAAPGRRPRDRGGARRDADRRHRQGPRGRRPPALGRGRQPVGAARPAPGDAARGAAGLRPGPARGRVPHARRATASGCRTPPPFHNKGNWIFSLAQLGRYLGRAGRGARGDGAARDRRPDAARRRRRRPRRRDRRQGPRPRGRADRRLRAGGRDPGPGHGAVRGDAGRIWPARSPRSSACAP